MSIAYYVISLAGKTFSNPWLALPPAILRNQRFE